jgi:glycosyltransferase involved in cell wall biosynthesis
VKKLLMVGDYFSLGGAEKVFSELRDGIQDSYIVDVFFGDQEGIMRNPFSYVWNRKASRLLMLKLNSFSPDIIHVNNFYQLLTPSILSTLIKYKKQNKFVKIIHTAHDYHLISPNSGMNTYSFFKRSIRFESLHRPGLISLFSKVWDRRGPFFSMLKVMQWFFAYRIKKLDDVFDVIISPSKFLGNAIAQYLPGKSIVVRNPILVTDFEADVIRAKEDGICRLVFLGRVSAEKGILYFIKNVKSWEGLVLTIIGTGPHSEEIKRFVTLNGLQNHIISVGHKNKLEIVSLLRNQDLHLMSSLLYENAPLSIVETAVVGLPTICPDYGGMKEIANIVGGGIFYNPFDSGNINSTLLRVKELFRTKQLKSPSIQNIKQIFDPGLFISEHKRLYESDLKK